MNRLFVGAMTGFIAGLLFAPQTGEKTRAMFKERFSSFRDTSRDTSVGREYMKEGWTGGTNDGATEQSFGSTVREDYLH